MSLPDTVRVKLSSEAAEYVSITPVVVREMPVRELIEQLLANDLQLSLHPGPCSKRLTGQRRNP